VKNGTSPYHFIEVMGCPGGCIMGGARRSEVESARVLELESENQRLKGELAESMETVDILKTVMSKYTGKRQGG